MPECTEQTGQGAHGYDPHTVALHYVPHPIARL